MKKILALLVSLTLFCGMGEVSPTVHAEPVASLTVQRSTFEQNVNSVVRVVIEGPILDENGNEVGRRPIGFGTGTAIDARHVITAGHVVEDEPGVTFLIEIFGDDSSGLVIDSRHAHILKADYEADLGLLEIEGDDFLIFTKLVNGTAKTGDWIYTVGGPLGEPARCVTWGTYAVNKARTIDLAVAMISTQPGASGSAIWNKDNQFLGILVRGAPGVILFVRASDVDKFMADDSKLVKHDLGVTVKVGNGKSKCDCCGSKKCKCCKVKK
jgi:S1-C subfamily serine protease